MKNNDKKLPESKIRKKLLFKELFELLKILLIVVTLCSIFAYIGYSYSINNDPQNIFHNTIFVSIYPIGILLFIAIGLANIVAFVIYTIIFAIISDLIPLGGGIVIYLGVIITFIKWFIKAICRDRTKEIKEYYEICDLEISQEDFNIKSSSKSNIKSSINSSGDEEKKETKKESYLEKHNLINPIDKRQLENPDDDYIFRTAEEYECLRCGTIIDFGDCYMNEGLCEDCYKAVHTDKNGVFHEDKIFE